MNADIFGGGGARTGPLAGFLKQGNTGNGYGAPMGGTDENYNYSIPTDAFYSA